ncbi:hypothetical protein [Parasulfitobacter algicola]|uniref:Glycosyl transferase family 2 n=1 Tax=Parasulfitobacter algicola TaxID=2614809 RepID=A0ABX2IVM9_9RHOB|nr:hypothetical protein [Sulfitobacter algicola]NSX54892.1 hypothetical protein [Sulfitobacter algicola]
MRFESLQQFLAVKSSILSKGPIAIILIEDDVELETTLRHHLNLGFQQILAIGPETIPVPDSIAGDVIHICENIVKAGERETVINQLMVAAPDIWFYYCFNAEYLFFPFCESRTVGEMLAFHTEERRKAMLTYVIDLYAGDLGVNDNAVSLTDAYLDKSGYYSLARKDAEGTTKDRQLDFFGGLKWRFEEHIPFKQRRIDRIGLFKSAPGLKLTGEHLLNEDEYNTYACQWHHNLTAAICSFRTAKALIRNPASRPHISGFKWHNSVQFKWSSQQLMDLGLMEPGQWF